MWRSSDDLWRLSPTGVLLRDNTVLLGVLQALGFAVEGLAVRVVWLSAAKLTTLNWTPPNAANPTAPLSDSIRVVAINKANVAAPGATVLFNVTAGNGKVSATKAVTDGNGVAAVQWTLGPANGLNRVTATVVDDEGNAIPWVNPNVVSVSVTSYKALDVVGGGQQTATILPPSGLAFGQTRRSPGSRGRVFR